MCKKFCGKKDCSKCFELSFASHPRAKNWSERNKFKPWQITKKVSKKFEFKCDVCDHYFISRVSDVVFKTWCPYCARKKLCDDSKCNICFNISFASYEKSRWWSSKNIISPRFVFKRTIKKYYFDCNKCNHCFRSSLESICAPTKLYWCLYCAHRKLCDDINCMMCFNKSFASHEKSKFLSDKNINPRKIFKNSRKIFEFTCKVCNGKFNATLNHISRYNRSSWCPHCVNKTEKKLFDYLSKKYIDIKKQYKPKWCKSNISNRCLPFDFFIPSLNIIIELDGPQHFKQISNWDDPKYTQSKDLYKMKKAYDNKISVIRIPYEYIFDNKKFEEYKDIIIQNLILREKPEIVYLCNDNRYEHFKNFDFSGDELPKIISKEE